jgi:sortase A
MHLNRIVVEGASAEELTKGPAHFSETPLPGQLGNAAIAGHRTTYLHPFYDIDTLQPGDEITVTTLNGRYVYAVTGTKIVSPDDYDAVIPTDDPTAATLTLVSCTPKYSAKNRIVVHAELVADRSDPLTQAAPDPTTVTTLPAETTAPTTLVQPSTDATTTVAPATTTLPPSGPPAATGSSTEAFTGGWFSDTGGIPHALVWGALLGLVTYGSYWVSRRARRYWVGILAGCVPFLVVLYFFYENVNRLLPANL